MTIFMFCFSSIVLRFVLGKLSQILNKQAECQNLSAHSNGFEALHIDNRNMKTQVPLVASTDDSIEERTNIRYESFLQK